MSALDKDREIRLSDLRPGFVFRADEREAVHNLMPELLNQYRRRLRFITGARKGLLEPTARGSQILALSKDDLIQIESLPEDAPRVQPPVGTVYNTFEELEPDLYRYAMFFQNALYLGSVFQDCQQWHIVIDDIKCKTGFPYKVVGVLNGYVEDTTSKEIQELKPGKYTVNGRIITVEE